MINVSNCVVTTEQGKKEYCAGYDKFKSKDNIYGEMKVKSKVNGLRRF